MATNGSFNQQDQFKNATEQYPATSGASGSSSGNGAGEISKDEVGWYFVEQYYTTLSKSPEKLHLFYGKRSQFVSGLEGGISPVSVGRTAIQERIRDLDFQDCKVRVTNVDSQSSFENIVIQVIGETSNKSAELKKFVQTFVLAQQPTGYFVLNDIFRYINEEGEEEQTEATVPAKEETPVAPLVDNVEMPSAPDAVEPVAEPEAPKTEALNADIVDKKLEEAVEAEAAPAETATNGTPAEVVAEIEETPAEPKAEESAPTPEAAEKAVEEEIKEPEKPKDPVPTPELSRQPSAVKPAAPAQPAAPPKPLSWASRAAAAVGAPKPALPKAATPPAQVRAAAPAQAQAKAQAPAPTPATPTPAPAAETKKENVPPAASAGEWQTAGGDHQKRQNRPQSISQAPPEKDGTMGYVRNVTINVKDDELRSVLESFGELIYFDINRGKNCAFVEYKDVAGYQAAASASPHKVGNENVFVEPRRPKLNGPGFGFARGGGMQNRGSRQFEQGRQGQQPGRGNFGANRGRGNANGPRGGRGGGQVANA